MKQKALRNIPKPDEDKLAIFYGQNPQQEQKKQQEMTTVGNMTTVDKMTTVVNEEEIKARLKPFITNSQQLVYISLYKKASERDQDVTEWLGYTTLTKDLQISLKTVQRAIERLIKVNLIERVKISNNAKFKGSKYRIYRPDHVSEVNKMSTVDIK